MPATMMINTNNSFTVDVTIADGNKYDNAVQVRFAHNFGAGKVHRTDEIFLTPIQLDLLGRFLIRQANELQMAQSQRETA